MPSTSTTPTGLGIDIPFPHITSTRDTSNDPSDTLLIEHSLNDASGGHRPLPVTYGSLRSSAAMEGLLRAEIGDSMVEIYDEVSKSRFREGQRIIPGTFTPNVGCLRPELQLEVSIVTAEHALLSRHGTLFSSGATPDRNAAELKSILGNAASRLKPGATLIPAPRQPFHAEERTSLEQAKARARVEVDIILESNTCVQGGYLRGHIRVHIRKCTKKESPIMISDGKIRIIGFECISNNRERYPFYQCSSPLSTVASSLETLYASQHDEEGFSEAKEGEHMIPFSMYLPLSGSHGVPKGVFLAQPGVAVRYIAIASIKIKDSTSNGRSIAHFYRNCEIWPRLNPSVILAPAERPLQMTAKKGVFMGGGGKVDLTASLHRLHWIAGQQCCVKVNVINTTKKTIKILTLSLIRRTVIFKPDHRLDAETGDYTTDPDACQTFTTQKQVAESILEMGQRGLGVRGHASAKGWWTGVSPNEQSEFSHFILLPSDALSITRSRLLEVDYSIRVTLSAGTLKTADVQVILPIRIVNFLSVDPPPSFPLASQGPMYHANDSDSSIGTCDHVQPKYDNPRPDVNRFFVSYGQSEDSNPIAEMDDETLQSLDQDIWTDTPQDDNDRFQVCANGDSDWDDLAMYEDDVDEVVQPSLDPYHESAPRFADLYYMSIQDGLAQAAPSEDFQETIQCEHKKSINRNSDIQTGLQSFSLPAQEQYNDDCTDLHRNSPETITCTRPNRPRGPSSFTQRVQDKLQAAAAHNGSSSIRYSYPISGVLTPPEGVDRRDPLNDSLDQDGVSSPANDRFHFMQHVINPDSIEAVTQQYDKKDSSSRVSPNLPVYEALFSQIDSRTPLPLKPRSDSIFSAASKNTVNSRFNKNSDGSSRLLPRPPSMANIPLPTVPDLGSKIATTTAFAIATATTTPLSSIVYPYTSTSAPPRLDTMEYTDSRERSKLEEPASLETLAGVGTYLNMIPKSSMSTPGTEAGREPTSPVKNRIRELEERYRLNEL